MRQKRRYSGRGKRKERKKAAHFLFREGGGKKGRVRGKELQGGSGYSRMNFKKAVESGSNLKKTRNGEGRVKNLYPMGGRSKATGKEVLYILTKNGDDLRTRAQL